MKEEKKSYNVFYASKYKSPIPIIFSDGKREHSMEEHGKPIFIKTKKKKNDRSRI